MSDTSHTKAPPVPVAIVGMGCLFPGASGVKEYWRLLRGGEDQIRDVPDSHWSAGDYGCDAPTDADLTYCTRGAFLDPVVFDPTEFGIVPTALESTDTAQLLTLLAAKEALSDAGYDDEAEFDRSAVSVILGVTGALELVIPLGARLGHPIWRQALRDAGVKQPIADDVVRRIGDAYVSWQESSFPGLLGNVVAGRIANRLNLHGTNCVVDAACASSLSAVHLAMLELAAGRSDMVLTGGTDTFNDIFMFMCFAKTQALSKSGDVRPFSANADGTVIGEGVGVLALKRLDDAVRDRNRIYAVIRGVGTSSDGKSQSIYAPLAAGQARALRDAYEVAGVSPTDIELVEAHGTGTKVGDATEYEALRDVYRAAGEGAWCALGSVKSQIGHTKAAAGVAGLIKAALALHHKVLLPTIKIDQPNPAVDGASDPFYVASEIRPWLSSSDHPRTAAVSSFGFGGSNFHAVLSEHGETDQIAWDSGITLIAMSAADQDALLSELRSWKAFIETDPDRRAVAHRAAMSRARFRHDDAIRLVLVISKGEDVRQSVDEAISRIESGKASQPSRGIYIGHGSERGKLAFVFSGQASQYPNMIRDLVCAFPEARRAIEFSDRSAKVDVPLGSLIYPIPSFDPHVRKMQQANLTRTEHAQPALGAVSLALLRVLDYFGVSADMVAGHSYGELCALHAAGAIDEAALIRLSTARGRTMAQSADQPGTMLAVSAPLDQIDALVSEASLDAVLANRNGPTQGVLSGSVDAIEQAEELCRDRGWSTRKIDVSAAFHSKLMTAAAADFEREIDRASFSTCKTPVYATQNGATYPNDADAMKSLLAGQMLAPVDFVGQIRAMYDAGARTFVEVGPKRVLTSLIARILKDDSRQALPLDVDRPTACGLVRLAHVLAALAAGGFDVKLGRWDSDCPQPREPRMKVTLTGANYRAPRGEDCPPRSVPMHSESAPTENNRRSAANEKSPIPLTAQQPTRKTVTAPSNRIPDPSRQPASPVPDDQPSRPAASRAASDSGRGNQPAAPSGPMSDVLGTVQEGLRAMQSLQQQTAAAHQRFLEGQELAHQTFERVLNSQQRLMEHLLSGRAPVPPTPPVHESPAPVLAPPAIASSHAHESPTARPQVGPAASAETATNGDVEQTVIEALSATTGYPADAIHSDMNLTEDLNLDRVSRVRLLDELRGRIARFAEFDAEAIQRVGSVGELIDVSEGRFADTGAGRGLESEREFAAGPTDAAQADAATQTADPTGADPSGAEQTLIEVVAELTGYPAQMLDADMDLEADLGIDSIKRVEILATLQERIPQMNAVDSSYIGSLRTLRNIIEYIGGADRKASAADSTSSVKASPKSLEAQALPTTDVSTVRSESPLPERRVLQLAPLPRIEIGRTVSVAADREVWIASANSRLATALRDYWVAQGVPSRVIDPSKPPDRVDTLGGLVVIADDSTAGEMNKEAVTRRWLSDVFALTTRTASALASAATSGGAIFATVSRMDGQFGLTRDVASPLQGALAGLVKTAQHEWPNVRCKALDVSDKWSDVNRIAEVIAAELASDGPVEVAHDGSSRFGLTLIEAPPTPGELELDSSDVVLVTGGARGVTADCVMELAQRTGATFRLWGRTPPPTEEPDWLVGVDDPKQLKRLVLEHAFEGESPTPKALDAELNRILAQREIRSTLNRIGAVGGRAVYSVVNVRDPVAVQTAVEQIERESGVITALIHGAGVIDDRLIADKTVEQFDRVFGVKVDGLMNVLSAIDVDKLRRLVLFSSVSARFGNRGQADYAMANEALNKIAWSMTRRLPNCTVASLNWGPWNGGMVTPALAREFARRGVGLIPPKAGAEAMVLEMEQSAGVDVEVVLGDGLCPPAAACGQKSSNDSQPATQRCAANLNTVFSRRLSMATHSFLNDHVIAGRPVLPAAMMLEWLAHGAMHDNPGLRASRVDGFRVLRGVLLERDSLALSVVGEKTDRNGGHLVSRVELRSGANGEALHARASVTLMDRLANGEAIAPQSSGFDRVLGQSDDVYRHVLFHGPRLRFISSLTRADQNGIAATLRTQSQPSDWMDDPVRTDWVIDPAIVDGVLQLGIVWCHDQLDALSLPSAVHAIELFASPYDEQVRAMLHVRRATDNRMTADALVINDSDQIVMRLSGVEWTVDPSLRDSFGSAVAAGVNF